VYRSTTPNGTYSPIDYPSSASYTDDGLDAGETYYYKVSAVNNNGESEKSSYEDVTTGSDGPPAAPTGLSVAGTTSSSISLSWNSVSGASNYYVYRSTSASGEYENVGTVSYTSYTDIDLDAGEYYYKVSAVNSSGEEGSSSDNISATTTSTPSATALTVNVWKNDTITSDGEVYYSFNVTSGTKYYIWWNDSSEGEGKAGDIKVSAFYGTNNGSIFSPTDKGWTSPKSFTANADVTVFIKVVGNAAGTYGIVYSTNSTKPTP
jgi:hypothetical protein